MPTLNISEEALLPYRVGGLLYMPAFHPTAAQKILSGSIPYLTAAAFCLEDSVADDALESAEKALREALRLLQNAAKPLPLLFVRVRSPQHLSKIRAFLREEESLLTGYILPKFDLSNCEAYLDALCSSGGNAQIRAMPILETEDAVRPASLDRLKQLLDSRKERILNIRIGGNDLCSRYGLRRGIRESIYEIGVVRDALVRIAAVFSADYVVSAAVWEYFGEDPDGLWAAGLRRELALDRLNGFTGKTAIHPAQLPVIYDAMRVPQSDYQDALRILSAPYGASGVEKSADGSRMNEWKCHTKWAERICKLAQIYGCKEDS